MKYMRRENWVSNPRRRACSVNDLHSTKGLLVILTISLVILTISLVDWGHCYFFKFWVWKQWCSFLLSTLEEIRTPKIWFISPKCLIKNVSSASKRWPSFSFCYRCTSYPYNVCEWKHFHLQPLLCKGNCYHPYIFSH